MNAYKVWAGETGYMIQLAETASAAKRDYWKNFMAAEDLYQPGADIHCRLIERNVIITNGRDEDVNCRDESEYEKSRHYDLIFAGITHPNWAEARMCYDWWWEDWEK